MNRSTASLRRSRTYFRSRLHDGHTRNRTVEHVQVIGHLMKLSSHRCPSGLTNEGGARRTSPAVKPIPSSLARPLPPAQSMCLRQWCRVGCRRNVGRRQRVLFADLSAA